HHIYPDHPNVLPAYMNETGGLEEWVRKPIFGREGEGIEINSRNFTIKSPYEYPKGEEFVYQQWAELPNFPGDKGEPNYPVLGTWVVNGKSV
ncbi:glutathionylspermidine synthase family protein, partial [Acinetobacter baumannii]|uniref:glutathionylspermidine synthase family protein n=1 Tax=Acinetobacter baumannii TaxID=470 RepID=UPI00312CAFAD